jgi:hypothetical protein
LGCTAAQVHLQRAACELGARHRLGAPNQGAHPCDQFGELEWLRHEIVASQLQGVDSIAEGIAGGENEHRTRIARSPPAPDQLESIHSRQAQIHHRKVERLVPGAGLRFFAGAHVVGRESGPL